MRQLILFFFLENYILWARIREEEKKDTLVSNRVHSLFPFLCGYLYLFVYVSQRAMGFLSNPKFAYFVRIAQLVFGIGFLILVCYAGTHRGWWRNINGALAVGGMFSSHLLASASPVDFFLVIAVIFTLAVTVHSIWTFHRSNPFTGHGKTFTFVRLGVEVLVILLWIATASLMLRGKGGCRHVQNNNGLDWCFDKEDDTGIRLTERPLVSWNVAVALAFVEM